MLKIQKKRLVRTESSGYLDILLPFFTVRFTVLSPISFFFFSFMIVSNPGEVKFFRQIRYELRKVAVHFALCEAQLCERYIQLISALENFIVHRTSTSTPNGNTNITMTNEDIGTEARRLLAMVVKLSSFAIQLENYAVMNYCGFGKALKKHDKITGESTKLAVMQAWVNVQSFAEYPILLKLLSGIEEAWRLLVALQPEEASINMVDNDEAKTLMNLHHVKSFSNMHRAKEMAERHTSTSSLSLNSIPSSPSVYPRGPSNNGLSIHPANDSTTTNLLTNIYPLTHHSGSSSVQPMHNNTTGSNYIHPYNGSDAHTLQTNRSMKRELEHTTVGISSTTPSSSGSTLYSSSSSNVISSSSSNVTPPNVHTNNNDSSVGSSTSTTGKRRRVGTHV